MIARALGIDPVEFRRKNILREGRPQATGTVMKDAAIEAVLDRARAAHELDARRSIAATGPVQARARHRHRLQGLDLADHVGRHRQRQRRRQHHALLISTVDMGQGSDTAMAQIVAEVLDIPAERIKVVHPDTDVTPYDMGDARLALDCSTWAMRCGSRPRMPQTSSRRWRARLGLPEGTNCPVAEMFQKKYKMQAGNIIGTGTLHPELHAARSRTA